MPSKAKHLCITKFCRNDRVKNRKLCHKCKLLRYRTDNPIRYAYRNVADRANKYGYDFSLSFDEFKAFCDKTGYLKTKGSGGDDMSIDRIDSSKGYSADNIQILTKGLNAAKNNRDYRSPKYIAYLKSIGEYQPIEAERQNSNPVSENDDSFEGY